MPFSRFSIILLTITAFTLTGLPSVDAYAKSGESSKKTEASNKSSKKSTKSVKRSSKKRSKKHAGSARNNEAMYSALVVNADTGQVLYEKNAGSERYPASLTKMMTLYLTFDAIKNGKLDLDDRMKVSAKAASQPQTNISLDEGDYLPVRAAIESLVVRSANDAAMVLAEKIGGTEWNFALSMTKKARELGMKDTIFRNPSGLPDNKQHTNAYDMARLAIALRRDFPEYYHFFKMKSFTWNGITYPGHNHVMKKYPGVDGVKTGYIRASGYNLVTSATRSGHRLVAVVMGGSTISSRDNQMISLLDRTFASLEQQEKSLASKSEAAQQSSTVEARNIFPSAYAATVH